MANDKNDKLDKKAKGIYDGLAEMENDDDKKVKKSKNKKSKEEKKKRSFTLTSSQVEKIYLLKAKNSDMTMSEIVGQAIDKFYESESEN
jgi:hypothetical protein